MLQVATTLLCTRKNFRRNRRKSIKTKGEEKNSRHSRMDPVNNILWIHFRNTSIYYYYQKLLVDCDCQHSCTCQHRGREWMCVRVGKREKDTHTHSNRIASISFYRLKVDKKKWFKDFNAVRLYHHQPLSLISLQLFTLVANGPLVYIHTHILLFFIHFFLLLVWQCFVSVWAFLFFHAHNHFVYN